MMPEITCFINHSFTTCYLGKDRYHITKSQWEFAWETNAYFL